MFTGIDHIGIAVKSLEQASELYTRLLGRPAYKKEALPAEGVETAFFDGGGTKVELLEALGPDSPVSRFIEKRGEGLHHIAFEVADIGAEISRLKEAGFEFVSEEPRRGADNKLICFLHPKGTLGTLVELCQDLPPAGGRPA